MTSLSKTNPDFTSTHLHGAVTGVMHIMHMSCMMLLNTNVALKLKLTINHFHSWQDFFGDISTKFLRFLVSSPQLPNSIFLDFPKKTRHHSVLSNDRVSD